MNYKASTRFGRTSGHLQGAWLCWCVISVENCGVLFMYSYNICVNVILEHFNYFLTF